MNMQNIKFSITRNNIRIYDSYKIVYRSQMIFILNYIRKEALKQGIAYSRSNSSWIKEWCAHNLLYNFGLFVSHTKDVDLNEDESEFRLFLYDIISFFYRPKKAEK